MKSWSNLLQVNEISAIISDKMAYMKTVQTQIRMFPKEISIINQGLYCLPVHHVFCETNVVENKGWTKKV